MDKLEALLAKQKELQITGMHYNFDTMTTEERAAYVKEYALHCEHELHECLAEIPFFKPWKRYDHDAESEKNTVMWAAARKEFIDALHFFLCVAIGLGFTADELSQVVDETVDFSRIPGVTKSQIMDIMERYYDGYVFSPESDEHVFNTNMCQVFLKNLIDQRHIPY